jgi:CRP/FNR family transcriptional regulator
MRLRGVAAWNTARDHDAAGFTPDSGKWDVDFLSLLTLANQRRLLENSTQVVLAAGTLALRPGDSGGVFLLQRGLVRSYWTVPDGRETTIAFIYPGNLLGATYMVPRTAMPKVPGSVAAQLVVDSTLTCLDLGTVQRLMAREIEVVVAIATCLGARVRYDARRLAVGFLGSLRERLAFDLLERASRTQLSLGRLEAIATHQELADSIGSSREVVSRALKALRAERIIETAPGVTRVLDPMRLAIVVRAFVM